jgi:hypothetical protein
MKITTMNIPMKSIATAAAFIALGSTGIALGSTGAVAEEVQVNLPHTAAAAKYSELLGRGTRAVAAYVAACADQDWPGLTQTLTDDAVVEYPMAELGTYLTVDASAVAEYCSTNEGRGHIASLWAFPTGADSILIKYSLKPDGLSATGKAAEHLVQINMRGDQISRLRDLTSSAENIERLAATQRSVQAP